MGLGVPVLARDVPGNRGLLQVVAESAMASGLVVAASGLAVAETPALPAIPAAVDGAEVRVTLTPAPRLNSVDKGRETGRASPSVEWELCSTGVLYSTPNGFIQALRCMFRPQTSSSEENQWSANTELSSAVALARRGIEAISTQECLLWRELLSRLV